MSDEPRDDDESQVSERRDELLRRMLKTPPSPQKPKPTTKPAKAGDKNTDT